MWFNTFPFRYALNGLHTTLFLFFDRKGHCIFLCKNNKKVLKWRTKHKKSHRRNYQCRIPDRQARGKHTLKYGIFRLAQRKCRRKPFSAFPSAFPLSTKGCKAPLYRYKVDHVRPSRFFGLRKTNDNSHPDRTLASKPTNP